MIIDTDKLNHDRSAPKPDLHDKLAHDSVMARGTNSTNYTTSATNQSLVDPSKNGQFTIVQVGTYTIPAPYVAAPDPGAGNFGNLYQTLYQAPHNLGFQPGVMGYFLGTGIYTMMPFQNYVAFSSSQVAWYNYEVFVDATNLYITLNTTVYGTPLSFSPTSFKWYLLYQGSN